MAFAEHTSPFDDIRALIDAAPAMDVDAQAKARLHREHMQKAMGALGRVGDMAVFMASWQGMPPHIERPLVAVFAGSYALADANVSQSDSAQNRQLIDRMLAGQAPVNKTAARVGAGMKVLELAVEMPVPDMREEAALSEEDCAGAIAYAVQALEEKPDALAIGIAAAGTTTAAAAIALALYGGTPEFWAAAGTALGDAEKMATKSAIISAALEHHSGHLDDPLEVLRRLGGRDIAAAAGAILAARHQGIPVILDGFSTCVAAAVLHKIDAHAIDHCLAGSVADSAAHRAVLERLGKAPVLDLGLGLGDGTGAAMCLGLLRGAVDSYNAFTPSVA